jgi:heme/copper-type cytochrome/quinol oxidase subunit 3
MWWFLASEIMVFGGLIACYVLVRLASGGWHDEAAHVSWRIAAVNTLVLLTSSLTMVLAHAAATGGDRGRAAAWLAATVGLGLGFLGIKAFEYSREIAAGFTPVSGLYWSFYYSMTGLHAAHVFAGVVTNSILCGIALGSRLWPKVSHRVEYAGLYWHFVDVVWIFLFPLLYLS